MTSDVDLTGVPLDLLQELVILPAQHFNPPPKLAPEQRLMMAVLNDAIRCVENYHSPTDRRGHRLFQEAKQWLLAAEPHWPYSFERICAVLDLDANAVRHHLRLAPERPPASCEMQPTKGGTAVNRTRPKASGTMPMGGSGTKGRIDHEEICAP